MIATCRPSRDGPHTTTGRQKNLPSRYQPGMSDTVFVAPPTPRPHGDGHCFTSQHRPHFSTELCLPMAVTPEGGESSAVGTSFSPLEKRPLTIQTARMTALAPRRLSDVCLNCSARQRAADSRVSVHNYVDRTELTDILQRPLHFQYSMSSFMPYSSFLYHHDHPFKYADITKIVLGSKRVEQGINRALDQELHGTKSTEKQKEKLVRRFTGKAKSIFREMHAKIWMSFCRFAGVVLHTIFPWVLSNVHISRSQVERLRTASDTGLPLVFLPLHRSHLDYLMLTLLLYHYNMRLPHIAAGDNLRAPFLTTIIQWVGGFFIRRRMEPVPTQKDYVYRHVLQSYITELVRANESVEFFIEAGRSRTGKTMPPKAGLLSVLVSALCDGELEDAFIVPVSISYDALPEGSFANQLMGRQKKQESLLHLMISLWRFLIKPTRSNVKVDIAEPMLLRDLLAAPRIGPPTPPISGVSPSSCLSLASLATDDRQAVDVLAAHLTFDLDRNLTVMPLHIVCFALLNMETHRSSDGSSLTSLVDSVETVVALLPSDKRVWLPEGEDMEDCVVAALHKLGKAIVWWPPPVENNDSVVAPVTTLPTVHDLAYYANALVSSFALRSALVLATRVQSHDSPTPVTASAAELLHLLRHAFAPLCAPCLEMERALEFENTEDFRNAIRDDADRNELYGNVLRPYVGSYRCVIRYMSNHLIAFSNADGCEFVEEKSLIKEILSYMQEMLACGKLKFAESVNADNVRACLRLLTARGALMPSEKPGRWRLGDDAFTQALDELTRTLDRFTV